MDVENKGRGISRRKFLTAGAAAGGVLGFGALDGLINRKALAQQGRSPRAGSGEGGYGELMPITRTDPETGFEQTLWLPEGFDFALFGLTGTELDDGSTTPLAHDGMAAFPGPSGSVRLVRNHEDRNPPVVAKPSGPDAGQRYDQIGGGGTTTLQVRVTDEGDRVLEAAFTSISGTIVNCAGGPTPQGSWITCEETTQGTATGWEEDHGYNFEVPSGSGGSVDPVPFKAMGRFVHEAAAVDPRTGIVYETEDRRAAGFYRFLPNDTQDLSAGGRLQMLAVRDRPQFDTSTGQTEGRRLPVEWVDIDDPDPVGAEANPSAVYEEGFAKGGAIFSRVEGCWWGEREMFFCCTDGGDEGEGQVWEYRPRGNSGGQLTLVYESPGVDVLSFPDNITVTPGGGLLLCEDTPRRDDFFLQGLTRDGRIFQFAGSETGGEWAGATFSPDGETLFVNL